MIREKERERERERETEGKKRERRTYLQMCILVKKTFSFLYVFSFVNAYIVIRLRSVDVSFDTKRNSDDKCLIQQKRDKIRKQTRNFVASAIRS